MMCSDGREGTLGSVTKEEESTSVFGFTFAPDLPVEVYMPTKVTISSLGEEAGVKHESIRRSRPTADQAVSDTGTADDWPPLYHPQIMTS